MDLEPDSSAISAGNVFKSLQWNNFLLEMRFCCSYISHMDPLISAVFWPGKLQTSPLRRAKPS